MTTRIGFDQAMIAHRGLSPVEILEFARLRDLGGVQFREPGEIDPALNPAVLSAFRRRADLLGLDLEVGLPSPNPVRRSRQEGRAVSAAEHADDLAAQVAALAALGCARAHAFVGDRHDRFRRDTAWPAQIDAAAEVLDRLAPVLREHGVVVAVETHADLTTDELLAFLDRLDPDISGVALDTGNLLMRLDDPVRAVKRLAGRVVSARIKDCVLAFTPRGLCWQARPVGSGVLPMPDLLAPLLRANPALNLTIALHPQTHDLPTLDPSWLAYFPGLAPDSLAATQRLAEVCEARYASGFLDRPEMVESVAWADRDLDWLALSLGYLRRVVPALARIGPPSVPDPNSAGTAATVPTPSRRIDG